MQAVVQNYHTVTNEAHPMMATKKKKTIKRIHLLTGQQLRDKAPFLAGESEMLMK